MLSKDSVHQFSNNSTVFPSSIKQELSHPSSYPRYNISPTNVPDPNTSVELTEEPPITHRSDDLLNTSTDLEPTSRQSVYPIANKSYLSTSPQSLRYYQKPSIRQLAPQPGYQGSTIVELPTREELMSNQNSREQSHHSVNRHVFNSGRLHGLKGL
jgi:hypothetical protein